MGETDTISRQAALDAIMGQPPEPHYPSWYAAQIEKLPAVQPDHTADIGKKAEKEDCISRQAAIDIERNATVDTNPSHFEAHQKFTQFMDDVEVSSFGRWQWSNGFNTALTAVGIDLKKLPSAQPERKRGEWIYNSPVTMKCDQCGLVIKDWDWHRFKYCPNCGADMRKENES